MAARLVRTSEVVPALRLILGSEGKVADESQARELMKFTAQRGINLADIWITESKGQVLWATLPVTSPGHTVLFFGTSASLVGPDLSAMNLGLQAISRCYAQQGVQLAQVLLDPADTTTIACYVENEFARMAELIYLQKTIRRGAHPDPLHNEFRLTTYSDQTHASFATAVINSYQNSLDCPALNGMRNIEDILAGHKAAGPFDPKDWYLLMRGKQPVAVLLLSKTHQLDGMELVYLGLVPQIRGLGLGNYLMQIAEARVYEHRLQKLTLAVDSKNQPALKLYYRHGMQQIGSKTAMMRRLKPSNDE